MLNSMLIAAMMATTPTAEQDQRIWATAVARHQALDRAIVYRYVQAFESGFDKGALPTRIDVVWDYDSSSGMPSVEERERMDAAEDAIVPRVQQNGAAVLVYVETGEGRRQWSFHIRSEDEFMQRLSEALSSSDVLPIQVESVSDPDWSFHADFLHGLMPADRDASSD